MLIPFPDAENILNDLQFQLNSSRPKISELKNRVVGVQMFEEAAAFREIEKQIDELRESINRLLPQTSTAHDGTNTFDA
jgi:hypothetical protein